MALAIGALKIVTTMMGSVIEQTKEIAVLRALGLRSTHIIKELMIEMGAIGTAGGYRPALESLVGAGSPWSIRETEGGRARSFAQSLPSCKPAHEA